LKWCSKKNENSTINEIQQNTQERKRHFKRNSFWSADPFQCNSSTTSLRKRMIPFNAIVAVTVSCRCGKMWL
jgi:hypothetical protein